MSADEKSLVALSGSRERFDNIELLRAFAVLAVVLYHYTAQHPSNYMRYATAPWPATYGFMGVELFFIISGYCITMTAAHCRGLALFWARRLSRLWPAYIAAIAITFFVVRAYGLPGREYIGLAAILNALWLNAIPKFVPHIDGVYWSLIIELKLYILFGLVYFGVRGRGEPVLWWTLLCLLGSAVALYDREINAGFAVRTQLFGTFIFPHSGFFLAGMLLYRWQTTPHWLKALAIAAYAWNCFWFGRDWTESILYVSLLPLCKIVLDWKTLWVPGPIVFIGFISYPLYLVHQHVGLVLIRETAATIPSEYARIALAAAATILIAALVSVTVEHRFRKYIERPIELFFGLFIDLPLRLLRRGKPTTAVTEPHANTPALRPEEAGT